jgi:hypothetical protein
MKSQTEMRNEAPALANLANLAKQSPREGLATLAETCLALDVDPARAKVRLSLAEARTLIECGDIPAPLVERYAVAIGRARARP